MSALRWLLLPALFLAASPPPQAQAPVQHGEDLTRFAARTVGDPQAASEIRELNGLGSDAVAEGTTLKLPGPDRNLALSAISAARNALQQAGKDSPRRDDAAKQLADAEQLFKTARYQEAAKAADGAWRLVSDRAGSKTQFTVEVAKDGKTEVKSTAGQPVRVEAQGTVSPVYPGQVVAVVKGEAPKRVETSPGVTNTTAEPATGDKKLAAPVLTSPNDKGALAVKEVAKGTLAPVTLSWKPVDGAAAYEVEVVRSGSGKPIALKVDKPQAQIDGLSPGSYQWSVRAVADGARSERSGKRTFEVSAEGFKLEVKDTKWK